MSNLICSNTSHSSLPFYFGGHHLASGPFYLVVGYNTCHLAFSLPGSTCSKSLCLQINLPRVKPCSDDSLPQNPSVTFYYLLNNACNSCQFGRIKLSLILESVRFGLRFWLLHLSVLWLWTYCLIFIHSFIPHMFTEHLLHSRLYMKPMRWSDEPNRHCPFLLDLKRIRLVHISHDHSNPKYRPYFDAFSFWFLLYRKS